MSSPQSEELRQISIRTRAVKRLLKDVSSYTGELATLTTRHEELVSSASPVDPGTLRRAHEFVEEAQATLNDVREKLAVSWDDLKARVDKFNEIMDSLELSDKDKDEVNAAILQLDVAADAAGRPRLSMDVTMDSAKKHEQEQSAAASEATAALAAVSLASTATAAAAASSSSSSSADTQSNASTLSPAEALRALGINARAVKRLLADLRSYTKELKQHQTKYTQTVEQKADEGDVRRAKEFVEEAQATLKDVKEKLVNSLQSLKEKVESWKKETGEVEEEAYVNAVNILTDVENALKELEQSS